MQSKQSNTQQNGVLAGSKPVLAGSKPVLAGRKPVLADRKNHCCRALIRLRLQGNLQTSLAGRKPMLAGRKKVTESSFLQVSKLSDLGLYIGDQITNPNHLKLRFLPPFFLHCSSHVLRIKEQLIPLESARIECSSI